MKKLARSFAVLTVLMLAVFGTTLSNYSPISRAEDPHRDPVCMNICFLEFQACFFAAQPKKSEMNKCNAEYKHCIAHCK